MKTAITGFLAVLAVSAAASTRGDEVVNASLEQGAYAAVDITVRGHAESVYAGAFTTTLGGGPSFESYCVDLDHEMAVSGNTFASTSGSLRALSGADRVGGAGVAWLVANIRPTTDREYAGLQAAIWSTAYGNNLALFGLADTANQHDVYTIMRADLAAVAAADLSTVDGVLLTATAHPNGQFQDLAAVRYAGGGPSASSAVPEPSTLVLLGLGLAGAATFRRRRPR